jgi:toxin ParE1/3/4
MGRARDELRPGLRSHPYRSYVIFFRCVEDTLEIVNVIEGHRDIPALFGKDERA